MLADAEGLNSYSEQAPRERKGGSRKPRLVWGSPRNLTALISHALAPTYWGTQHVGRWATTKSDILVVSYYYLSSSGFQCLVWHGTCTLKRVEQYPVEVICLRSQTLCASELRAPL